MTAAAMAISAVSRSRISPTITTSGSCRRMARRAGVSEVNRVSPHALRHTFATTLYSETTNIRLVQKALGHSYVSTTQIYCHLVDGELEAAMRERPRLS